MSRLGWFLVALVVLAGALGSVAYYHLRYVAPAPTFASAEEQFLYGSIGTEDDGAGIPYWLWLVLPRVFPEYLPSPGGYAAIGLSAPDGQHEMPIGLAKVRIGAPRVGVNCALCHTATVRARPGDVPMVFPGAPGHQAGAEEYRTFLQRAAADPRFAASTLLGEISKNVRLPLVDRLLYRFILIPQTRRALRRQAEHDRETGRPTADAMPWGRGRAAVVTRAGHDSRVDAAVDPRPLWHLKAREAEGYLWDRGATSLKALVQASALVEGASPAWMDRDQSAWDHSATEPSSLERVFDYLADLAPPAYPFPLNRPLASAGASVYMGTCAQCHEPGGARFGAAIPVDELGTDAARLQAFTRADADALNQLGDGHAWRLSGFRAASTGYVAPRLDGVWVSAPYLHNGSVPTLADLLESPANRPALFARGYDVYDQARVGFVTDSDEARRLGSVFDTSRPGNRNGGHAYGTTLSADDKRALLEYLKTR